jgi:phage terminase Nu1 subunit (DNA packaging protein)
MTTPTIKKEIGIQEVGELLRLSERRVQQLVNEGWITKSGRGRYCVSDVVHGHIDYLEDQKKNARQTATDDELRAERARKLRLENDRTEGILIESDAAMNVIDEICATYRIGLGALPARVTRDLAMRRKIEDEIDRILVTVADKFEDRAALLASSEDDEAPEEDDAG